MYHFVFSLANYYVLYWCLVVNSWPFSGHGVGMGGVLAGGAAAAAAAYGAHHLTHGHMGHHGYYGHHGKFKHGKFKHGKFGKRWKGGHGMFGKHKHKFFKW